MKTVIAVLVVLFAATLPSQAREMKGANGYVLIDNTWFLPHRGERIPVLTERDLGRADARWLVQVLRYHREFAAKLLERSDRWEFLEYGCVAESYHGGSYCAIGTHSIHSSNGSVLFEFPMKGEPTRVGRRTGLLRLGKREDVGSWKRRVFVADPEVREELLFQALYHRSRR